jgi:hypothetical protein
MSSTKYQALPSDDYDEERSPTHHRHIPEHHQLEQDPRFNPPTPPWWKRALVILFIIAMFWLYFSLRASMQRAAESRTVHAQRCVCMSWFFFCSSYFDRILAVWGADLFLLLSKDTQSNISTAPRRAPSFMRSSRTVKRAYEALPLPIDPSKLSYRDSGLDHGQLPRWTTLHWTVRYNNAFL